ncbi:MAG: hypothetical protein AB7H80_00545 [Candidatus Kapaibacterium sp.]
MRKTVFIVALIFAGYMMANAQEPTVTELQKDIEDLNTIDPDVGRYFPRWRILEADLKTKLALYFRSIGVPVNTNDTMTVTASFERGATAPQDILQIKAGSYPGSELNSRQAIEGALGAELYQQILGRQYAHAEIPPAKPITETGTERVPSVFYPTNAKQFVAVSLFRQAVQIGSTGARLEHLLGSDEVGYPFWSGGQGKALIDYPIIRQDNEELRANGVPDPFKFSLGVGYRLKFGVPDQNAVADIFSPRKLNGAIGAKAIVRAEYRLPQLNDLGIGFYTELPFNKRAGFESVKGNEEVVWVPDSIGTGRPGQNIPIRSAYFMRTVAQGNLFWETWLDNYEHYVRFSLGMSYQEFAVGALRVGDYWLDPDGETTRRVNPQTGIVEEGPGASPVGLANNVEYRGLVHPTEVQDWLYAKIEYLNQSDFPFGVSAQLANRNLLLTGFVPVVPNWLFLQAKYSTPLLRSEAAPWEQNPFIVISPVLRFMLD